jgi:hypothetical protein
MRTSIKTRLAKLEAIRAAQRVERPENEPIEFDMELIPADDLAFLQDIERRIDPADLEGSMRAMSDEELKRLRHIWTVYSREPPPDIHGYGRGPRFCDCKSCVDVRKWHYVRGLEVLPEPPRMYMDDPYADVRRAA